MKAVLTACFALALGVAGLAPVRRTGCAPRSLVVRQRSLDSFLETTPAAKVFYEGVADGARIKMRASRAARRDAQNVSSKFSTVASMHGRKR